MRRLAPLLLLAACAAEDPPPPEPRRVFLDRILITYRGNPFDIPAKRTLDEARRLARTVYRRAKQGEDFAKLRESFTDDRAPNGEANGVYILLNHGVEAAPTLMHVPRMQRGAMGKRLGDVAFRMQPGEIALVEHDASEYPAGFEIIRCLDRDDRTDEEVAADLKKPAR